MDDPTQLQQPASQGRQRAALACLRCRSAKNKCDGLPPPECASTQRAPASGAQTQPEPAPKPCSRCARLGLQCLWLPTRRTGRPRKRSRPSETNENQDGQIEAVDDNEQYFEQDQSQPSESSLWHDPSLAQATSSSTCGTSTLAYSDLREPVALFQRTTSGLQPPVSLNVNQLDLQALDFEDLSLPFQNTSTSARSNLPGQPAQVTSGDWQRDLFAACGLGSLQDGVQPLQLVNGNGPAEEADPSDEFFRDLLASLPSGGNAAHAPDSSPDSRRFGESKAASISTPNSSSATPQFSSPRAPTPAAVSNPLSALQDLQARFQTESSTMPPRASGSDAKSRSTRSEASAEELRNQSGLSVELIGDLDVEESAILRKGIDLYFNTAAYFAPVLGARQSFVSHVNLRPSLLLHAVATLGWRLASGNDLSARERADSALAIARELADEAIMAHAVSAASEAGESLYIIQALILLTYSEYGLGELARAGASARAAVRLAIEYGLHRVDATPPAFSSLSEHEPTSSAQPQASFSSRTRLLEGICARAETSHDLREALRRAWWELFVLDVMLHVVTSGEIPRRLGPALPHTAVNIPLDPSEHDGAMAEASSANTGGRDSGNTDESTSASSLAYNLRVRAAALLDEGLRSGESRGRSNQGATNLPRLRALDTMVDNTMVQGRLALRQARLKQAESRRKSSARGASHVTGTAADEALRTVEEMLFMAVIMLSAGRIHLHRISWFGNLDLSFESCSFRPKPEKHAQTCTPPPVLRSGTSQRMHPHASVELPARTVTEEEMESLAQSISTNSGLRLQQQQLVLRLDQQHLVTSVAKIVSAADTILDLVRTDMQACLSASCDDFESETEPAEPLLRHWPFFGCSQLVAAFGYVVAIAAGNENPEMDYGSPLAHLAGTHQNPESPLNSGAATQYPAQESSFPQMPTIAVDSASTWAQRMALSNITFALANLERLSVVWPVCLILRDEVRRCRDALDFGGPTGLGSPRR